MSDEGREYRQEMRQFLWEQRKEFHAQSRAKKQEMREKIEEHKQAIRDLQRQAHASHGAESRERRQRGIIKAALKILDREGIDGVTLRKLAQHLDIKAPALYWYFDKKSTLVDFMAEEILRQEFHDLKLRADDEPWQDWLMNVCKRLRKAMLSHRDGARVVAGAHLNPAVTLMQIFETSIGSLVESGIEPKRAGLIVATAVHFVFGRAIEEQNSPTMAELESMDVTEFMKGYPYMQKEREQVIQDLKNGYDEFEDALRLIIY